GVCRAGSPEPVMASKTVKLTVRMSEDGAREIAEAAHVRGYSSPTAFLRAAIRNELSERNQLTDTEQRIAASFDRVNREIFRMGRGQQALFALLDTFTKTMLTCIPEPPADAKRQAITRAKERYDTLMKTAGRAMVGDARAALLDLFDNASEG